MQRPNVVILDVIRGPHWVLCPSRRFPGRDYFYNLRTGEAAWHLHEFESVADYRNQLWVLWPSRRFPGKEYYYNLHTGEAVWKSDFEQNNMMSWHQHQQAYRRHSYPEPVVPPQHAYRRPSYGNQQNNMMSWHQHQQAYRRHSYPEPVVPPQHVYRRPSYGNQIPTCISATSASRQPATQPRDHQSALPVDE